MNGRVSEGLLIVLSLAAFVVAAVWLVSTTNIGGDVYPPMSTYSPRPEGCQALYELCGAAGFDVSRYHDSEYDYPAGGCMVVLDDPDISTAVIFGSPLDVRALRLWLADGGRLLLFSDPMRMIGTELFAELDKQEGLEPLAGGALGWDNPAGFDAPPLTDEEWEQELGERQSADAEYYFDAPGCLLAEPLAQGGEPGNEGALWRMYEPGRRFGLAADRPARFGDVAQIETAAPGFMPFVRGDVLLASTDPLEPIVMRRSTGSGEVIWVTHSEIAANDWLDRADNHRLVLALLDHLAAEDPVHFDEHLHGYYRERANPLGMLTGTTGGRLLLVLACLVTALFLGAAVRPAKYRPQPVPPRRQASEMVLAQANLYRRARASRGVAEALVEGVRRSFAQAVRGGGPASAKDLLHWLRREQPALGDKAQPLADYLAGKVAPEYRQLPRLAAACDLVRRSLEG